MANLRDLNSRSNPPSNPLADLIEAFTGQSSNQSQAPAPAPAQSQAQTPEQPAPQANNQDNNAETTAPPEYDDPPASVPERTTSDMKQTPINNEKGEKSASQGQAPLPHRGGPPHPPHAHGRHGPHHHGGPHHGGPPHHGPPSPPGAYPADDQPPSPGDDPFEGYGFPFGGAGAGFWGPWASRGRHHPMHGFGGRGGCHRGWGGADRRGGRCGGGADRRAAWEAWSDRWNARNGGGRFDVNRLTEFINQVAPGLVSGLSGNNANNTNTTRDTNRDLQPPIDIFDTPSAYLIHVSLPGAKKEDIGVNWDADSSELSIGGVIYRPSAIDEEVLKTLALDEREIGAFQRKVALGTKTQPASVDAEGIAARMEDGVLVVTVPKLEAGGFVEVRKVEIS